MISYLYPSRFFRKEWHWFADPIDVPSADIVTFFSYNDVVPPPGFKKRSGWTTAIDLRKTEEEIWGAMRKTFVRDQIERAKRNGVEARVGIDWNDLVPLYTEFRRAKGLPVDDPGVFKHCRCYGAYYEGRLIAGAAFFEDERYARDHVYASVRLSDDGELRQIVGRATRLYLWEAIRDAKRRGLELFDFGGIAPESDDPAERSLAEFKEAFGGERKPCYYYTKVNSQVLKLWLRIRRFHRK